MSTLLQCRGCGGLIRKGRARCPHCDRAVSPSRRLTGIAAAVGLGSSLVACGEAPITAPGEHTCSSGLLGPLGSCVEPEDAGPVPDAGRIPLADYGIVVFDDAGPARGVDSGPVPDQFDAGSDAGSAVDRDGGER